MSTPTPPRRPVQEAAFREAHRQNAVRSRSAPAWRDADVDSRTQEAMKRLQEIESTGEEVVSKLSSLYQHVARELAATADVYGTVDDLQSAPGSEPAAVAHAAVAEFTDAYVNELKEYSQEVASRIIDAAGATPVRPASPRQTLALAEPAVEPRPATPAKKKGIFSRPWFWLLVILTITDFFGWLEFETVFEWVQRFALMLFNLIPG